MGTIETHDLPAQDLQGVLAAFERYRDAQQLSRRIDEAIGPVSVGSDEAGLMSSLSYRAWQAKQFACEAFEKYLISLIDQRCHRG